MPRSVRPDYDEAFWADLAARDWRRTRTAPPEATCTAFRTPIHRRGTYYRRPAYTDGTIWLSQQAYDAMIRRTQGQRASRSRRRHGE